MRDRKLPSRDPLNLWANTQPGRRLSRASSQSLRLTCTNVPRLWWPLYSFTMPWSQNNASGDCSAAVAPRGNGGAASRVYSGTGGIGGMSLVPSRKCLNIWPFSSIKRATLGCGLNTRAAKACSSPALVTVRTTADSVAGCHSAPPSSYSTW